MSRSKDTVTYDKTRYVRETAMPMKMHRILVWATWYMKVSSSGVNTAGRAGRGKEGVQVCSVNGSRDL